MNRIIWLGIIVCFFLVQGMVWGQTSGISTELDLQKTQEGNWEEKLVIVPPKLPNKVPSALDFGRAPTQPQAVPQPQEDPQPLELDSDDTAAPSVPSNTASVSSSSVPTITHELEGLASWYGGKFQGRTTANGEIFDTNKLTAAHKTLSFNTMVRVTNMENGKSVLVRINDRGPFIPQRIIDLSKAAATAIGAAGSGVFPVSLDIIREGEDRSLRLIQIASFTDYSNATDLLSRLQSAGLNPDIDTDDVRGVHRVVIRNITQADLPTYRTRLTDLGYSQVLVREQVTR